MTTLAEVLEFLQGIHPQRCAQHRGKWSLYAGGRRQNLYPVDAEHTALLLTFELLEERGWGLELTNIFSPESGEVVVMMNSWTATVVVANAAYYLDRYHAAEGRTRLLAVATALQSALRSHAPVASGKD